MGILNLKGGKKESSLPATFCRKSDYKPTVFASNAVEGGTHVLPQNLTWLAATERR